MTFSDFNLPEALMAAVRDVGYESPSPIQEQAIGPLLEGRDLVGRAPTGTGKTAAFALPLLARVDLASRDVQLLVLTPTRELAIQVAEALASYARHLPGFHVLPVYGGQPYGGQIRQLKRGVQAIVGTPGRVMDHMRKGTLKLDRLQALVLDEADEMLRMGFIDDVEWVLEQTPATRQIALFSATMPTQIVRIAKKHLSNAHEIAIKAKTATAALIEQTYWLVSGMHKLDALTRILEVEPFEGMLIFVRTKIATTELAEKLEARGYSAAALNGDMAQPHREQMIERLKSGSLDILVATDVAARGLDVDRITHVVNYDIPNGTESYVHRIGRTGRAGREGKAILFVAPRERRMLQAIERATGQKVEPMKLPTVEMVSNKRIADFKQGISDTIGAGELDFLQRLLEQYQEDHDVPAIEIAAALAKMALGGRDLVLQPETRKGRPEREERSRSDDQGGRGRSERDRGERDRGERDRSERDRGERDRGERDRGERDRDERPDRQSREPVDRVGMLTYRVEVGTAHGVQPGNLVGAIANETGLDARYIGQIDIQADYSLVDMPAGMPKDVFHALKNVWVCGQKLNISTPGETGGTKPPRKRVPSKHKPSPGKNGAQARKRRLK